MKIRITTTVDIIDDDTVKDSRTTVQTNSIGDNPRFLSGEFKILAGIATKDQDRYVRLVAESMGADSHAVLQPPPGSRCEKCGHAAHGPVCLSMASDNECNCRYAQ